MESRCETRALRMQPYRYASVPDVRAGLHRVLIARGEERPRRDGVRLAVDELLDEVAHEAAAAGGDDRDLDRVHHGARLGDDLAAGVAAAALGEHAARPVRLAAVVDAEDDALRAERGVRIADKRFKGQIDVR